VKEEVWRWWEETPHPEGVKWKTLEHNGPFFPPPYERLPKNVKFYYDGNYIMLIVNETVILTLQTPFKGFKTPGKLLSGQVITEHFRKFSL